MILVFQLNIVWPAMYLNLGTILIYLILLKLSAFIIFILFLTNQCQLSFHYLIPIKMCTPYNFSPLIFDPLIFAHPQILHPFNFRAPLFYCKFAVFYSFVAFFLLPLIFAHLHCANFLPLIFAQARCAKIKGARILMGIRYVSFFII